MVSVCSREEQVEISPNLLVVLTAMYLSVDFIEFLVAE
jgi:hypothetical protein